MLPPGHSFTPRFHRKWHSVNGHCVSLWVKRSGCHEERENEWTVVELKSICRLHSLSVRGSKAELLARVTAHFSQLYP